jgi:DNA-binding IclR family transcriptional regulator
VTAKTEGAQSIARAALLLRTLSSHGPAGASLMQLSDLTGMPKPTVHRILAAMLEERLVERPPGTRLYRLGPDMFAFGLAVRGPFDLRPLARPSLERLAGETCTTVYLGVRSGYDTLCLDRADAPPPRPTLVMDVSDRWPLGIGSSSLAMLAFLPEPEISEVVQFNARRVRGEDTRTFENIWRSIDRTRREGFAMRRLRGSEGLTGIAVPVFDHRRYPVASICAVAPAAGATRSRIAGVVDALRREAALVGGLCDQQRGRGEPPDSWRFAVRGGVAPGGPPVS